LPLCKRTNLEVNMIYDTKKYYDKFDARQKNFKVCEFWSITTGFCSKDNKKCNKGKPSEE
jgi:hypothetical protein